MTLRLAASPDEIASAYAVRASVRPATAAERLDCDRSQVYRLVRAREIEGHRIGKRGLRIYIDSLEAYRRRRATGAPPAPEAKKRPQRRGAAYHEMVAYLRGRGLLAKA